MTIIGPNLRNRKRRSYAELVEASRPSRIIRHAPDVIRPGVPVILACRVSGHIQALRGNLADSEANLRIATAELGGEVAGVVSRQWAGSDPVWLAPAAERAKRLGAVVFAETTDRLIRSPHWSKTDQHQGPPWST